MGPKSISHPVGHVIDLPRHASCCFGNATLIQWRPIPIPSKSFRFLPIHLLIESFQHHGAPRHDQCAQREESHPPLRPHHVEDGVGVVSVIPRARFDPRPVQEGEAAGQGERLRRGNGPRRGEEEQVDRQEEAGNGVETQIRRQRQLGPVRNHEALVHGAEGPVEDADEDLEWGGADGEGVFDAEEGGGGGQVGEDAGGEGEDGEAEPDYGEVLEVPAVGVVDGGRVGGEVIERVEE